MSSTPAQKYVCPRCRSSFDDESHFCRECGADMTRASALDAAQRNPSLADTGTSDLESPTGVDRRLADSNQAWLGKVVDGRYRVLEVIGRGGMGVVYRVEHLRMGKIAAMKVLHQALAQDAEAVLRFEREAAAVSRLHHPHAVQVFDFGNAHGALYLIMEYVRGQDLGHLIERDGPMPWARAAPLFAQICGALQEAHELGVVHRDLKPENVLITRTSNGRDYAKVLDFGLAKLDKRDVPTSETDKQSIVGTPYFMAPEQIRGDDVDARTDIYSFGALMFELLTGQHLYSAATAVGVLTKHLTADPDAPSMRMPKLGIPPQVDHLCRKALARDPEKRWQTAQQLADAIEDVYAETVGDITGAGARSALSRGLAGGRLALGELEGGSELRLRRADLESFERGLRRRRSLALGGTALLGLVAIGATAWAGARESPTLTEEHEPNNDPAHANKIAAGAPITGFMGRRMSLGEGDRDVFVVPWPAAARRVVTVSVTGVPNLDLALAITDGDGLHGVVADEGRVGDGEVIHRRAINGPLVITVSETLTRDQRPVENVSDWYTLLVTEERADLGEAEPNNNEADATVLTPTQEVRGYLDARNDLDLLRWTGGDGTFTVIVRADGLPLEWRIGDGKPRTPGAATVELHQGDLIRLERSDRAGEGALIGRDLMWSVVVTK